MKVRAPAVAAVLLLAACSGTASSSQAVPDLAGSSWFVEVLNGGEVADRGRSTVTFGSDGRATGSTGCNRWSAAATRNGSELTFGQAVSTRMACSAALMDQEQRFLATLGQTRSFSTDGPFMRLRDAKGSELARLVRD